jgi:hypothetical protein
VEQSSKPQPCNSRHPWWFGVQCELDAGHKGKHEAKLDTAGRAQAKIKWDSASEDASSNVGR